MEPAPPPPKGRSRASWAALAAVAIVIPLAAAALLLFRSIRDLPGEVAESSARALREVAAAFRTGTVTTSFRSYATEVEGTSRFQFAELRQLEVFERRDEAAILWGTLRLPEVVVEARAPIAYTYFVDLDEAWSFRLEGDRVFVLAPRVQWNRPAVDVSNLSYEVTSGSVFRDEALVRDRLRAELTGLAMLRARQNLPLVRETGRQKVAAFVEGWLVARFSDGERCRAQVRFADEPETPPPSLPSLPRERG